LGKKFIPFGKEGGLGDDIMTAIISKQNRFLKNSKQHIIHNLNDIDEIVEISLADDVDMDMEASGVTIREVLYNHTDAKGAQLFESIEKTNKGGTYRVLFDKAKTVEFDAVLDNFDGSLVSLGDWKNWHTHYRYHNNEEIIIVVSVPRPSATRNTSAFWTSHLAEFQIHGIPVEIDTSAMLHPPESKRAPWVKSPYSDILSNSNKQGACRAIPGQSEYAQQIKSNAENATTATESNSSRQGQVTWADRNMRNDTANINSGIQEESGNEAHVPPQLERALLGLAILKRKMEEIDLERKKFQTEQAKLSETVDTMLSSLNGLSDEMITMRKDMTQLSTTFREELSYFKRILFAQNGTKIASPRRMRVTWASSKEELSSADDVVFNIGNGSDSKDKGMTSNSAHRSKDSNSWDIMCETDMEGCNTVNEGGLTESVIKSTRRTLNPPPSPYGNNEVGGE
jgi:hypothetical protein